MQITQNYLTHLSADAPIYLFRITNKSGAYVEFLNYGARWISAVVPDGEQQLANVLVGYDDPKEYLTDTYYMGATIGRFANRIKDAQFTIGNTVYKLDANDGANSNHGGKDGLHTKNWAWKILPDGICFLTSSPNGEGGYPGHLLVQAFYQWTEQNELIITHHGFSDKATYLNMTNHAYFNLSGRVQPVTSHELMIPAHYLLETNQEFIPTGKRVPVGDTPFDFTEKKQIGKDMYLPNEQLTWNRGYNHCYVLKESKNEESVLAAFLTDPESKRSLTVMTDLPGVLLYTAGYYKHPDTAVCFETQYFPDTPSHPDFPSCLLQPGEEYRQQTIYCFGNI